jgi:hypothetical protein
MFVPASLGVRSFEVFEVLLLAKRAYIASSPTKRIVDRTGELKDYAITCRQSCDVTLQAIDRCECTLLIHDR